jgi:predicted transcriptional regulator
MQPNIFQIKPEHVGGDDVMQFLRRAVAKELNGKEYFIVNETTLDRTTPYSPTAMRKIVAFGVEVAGDTHAIYFDITDVTSASSINWLGSHK